MDFGFFQKFLALFKLAEDHASGLERVEQQLDAIRSMLMTQAENIRTLATRLDTATNEIASDLQALRDKIAEGTVTAEDVAPLESTIARLESLGRDPENPVPDTPVTPTEPTPPTA